MQSSVTRHIAKQLKYLGPPRLVYLGDSLSMPTAGKAITGGGLRHMLALPLHAVGISADEIVTSHALIEAGLFDT